MREPGTNSNLSLEAALKKMFTRYSARLTAATLGEQGVLCWDGHRMLYTPAFKVPVVDTTGAGDIFHAGFIYGLLAAWPLDRQIDFACAAAAMNCMYSGARGGIRPLCEIEEWMARTGRHHSAAFPIAAS